VKYDYLSSCYTHEKKNGDAWCKLGIVSSITMKFYLRHIQAGSLAGAAHLLKDNASVQRLAHLGQKPKVEEKAKSWFDLYFQYKY